MSASAIGSNSVSAVTLASATSVYESSERGHGK
jgi:hypothetical protein